MHVRLTWTCSFLVGSIIPVINLCLTINYDHDTNMKIISRFVTRKKIKTRVLVNFSLTETSLCLQ